MIALLCAVLSGGMFYLAEGLNNVWALGWIAPVPLLWLAYGNTPRWQLALAGVAAFAWGQAYLFQSYGGFSIPVVLRVLVPPVLLFGVVLDRGGPLAALLLSGTLTGLSFLALFTLSMLTVLAEKRAAGESIPEQPAAAQPVAETKKKRRFLFGRKK